MATNPERSTEEKATDRDVDQEPNDMNATIDGIISADEADRFADTIRPSWVQMGPTESVQKGADALEQRPNSSPNAASVVVQSDSTREDVDAELKIAAATILQKKKVGKKALIWGGGVAACVAVLIVFSVMTQKKQETSLWESDKADKPAPVESASKERNTEAKSGAKAEVEPSATSTAEPSSSAINPPEERVEQPTTATEKTDLAASSQSADRATTKPIDEKPAQAAAEPPKVRIRVTTVPVKAELTLDGSSVPNPFDQMLPKAGEHLFVAKASGYSKKYHKVAFDRDRELSLKLAPKKRKKRATRRTATMTVSKRKSAKKAPRKTPKPKRAASRTRSSRKGFVTDNPY